MSDYSEELFQLYVKGLLQGEFDNSGACSGPDIQYYEEISSKEVELNREHHHYRKQNPEFQAALEIMQSPLMKALA